VTDAKLVELRLEFRALIAGIMGGLEGSGWQPKISNARRTRAQQAEKVRLGYAMPGARNPGSHGWGLACDIIDRRHGWEVSETAARFFAELGDLALGAGLTWGGTWFGVGGTREHPTHTSPWNKWQVGWDPAHVQWPQQEIPPEWRTDYPPEL